MSKSYRLSGSALSSEVFADASVAELKVLIAVTELGCIDADELSERLSIPPSRVRSALTLWLDAGVIAEGEAIPSEGISYEFGRSALATELGSQGGVSTARTVRDAGLKELFDEIEVILECPALNTEEVKRVTALITELGVTPEYILTYASFKAEQRREKRERSEGVRGLRPVYLGTVVNDIKRLAEIKGITTLEELEIYLAKRKKHNSATFEIGKEILGLERALSDEELEAFTRWSEEYGFGAPIIKKAYSYTCQKQNRGYSLGYLDYVLTEWHKAGCKTVKDCEEERRKNNEKYKNGYKPREEKKSESSFISYDAEEAMLAALKRSYGDGFDK